MGRSILLLFEHIAFGGDIALEWKILWDGHIASVQGSAWKGSIASWRSLLFKVQNTGLDHNMLLWITLQCFDKLDCLLGGSKALELDGREWFNRHKYLQWSTAEWINFEQSWITVELTSKTVLKCCRVVIEMFYKVTEVLQKCIKW